MYESTDFDELDEEGGELLPGLRGWNAGLTRALWPSFGGGRPGRGGARRLHHAAGVAAAAGAAAAAAPRPAGGGEG